LRELAATPSLSNLIEAEMLPGGDVTTDDDIKAYIREKSGTVYHPVSTCRMGVNSDVDVVDPQLRVYGVSGLRVVDASVFPTMISGNTNAPTMMVAEKAADMILAAAVNG
ncbi:MAG: GMC oxidoreductase, partial [Planktomarina sp.]